MKTAVRTPTNPVTANATVGRGLVRPKFCKIENCISDCMLSGTCNNTVAIADKKFYRRYPSSESHKSWWARHLMKLSLFLKDFSEKGVFVI